MNKLNAVMITVFLTFGIISCTPEKISNEFDPLACCGEETPIPPPPPSDSIPNN